MHMHHSPHYWMLLDMPLTAPSIFFCRLGSGSVRGERARAHKLQVAFVEGGEGPHVSTQAAMLRGAVISSATCLQAFCELAVEDPRKHRSNG